MRARSGVASLFGNIKDGRQIFVSYEPVLIARSTHTHTQERDTRGWLTVTPLSARFVSEAGTGSFVVLSSDV